MRWIRWAALATGLMFVSFSGCGEAAWIAPVALASSLILFGLDIANSSGT